MPRRITWLRPAHSNTRSTTSKFQSPAIVRPLASMRKRSLRRARLSIITRAFPEINQKIISLLLSPARALAFSCIALPSAKMIRFLSFVHSKRSSPNNRPCTASSENSASDERILKCPLIRLSIAASEKPRRRSLRVSILLQIDRLATVCKMNPARFETTCEFLFNEKDDLSYILFTVSPVSARRWQAII